MTDNTLRPGWLRLQVTRSVARLNQLPPKVRASLAQPTSRPHRAVSNEEAAVALVRDRLRFAETGPYGDLAMGADRAALVAVAAVRDAGLLVEEAR